MKKEDNKLSITIFYIIAEKDHRIYKIYYTDYSKFLRELKYYMYGRYTIQVGVKDRDLDL